MCAASVCVREKVFLFDCMPRIGCLPCLKNARKKLMVNEKCFFEGVQRSYTAQAKNGWNVFLLAKGNNSKDNETVMVCVFLVGTVVDKIGSWHIGKCLPQIQYKSPFKTTVFFIMTAISQIHLYRIICT